MAGEIYSRVAPEGKQSALSQFMNLKRVFDDAVRQNQIQQTNDQRKMYNDNNQRQLDRQNSLKQTGVSQQTYTPTPEDLGQQGALAMATGPSDMPESSTDMPDTQSAGALASGTQTDAPQMGWHESTKKGAYQFSPEEAQSAGQKLVDGLMAPAQLRGAQRAQAIDAAGKIDPNYNAIKADVSYAATRMGASAFKKFKQTNMVAEKTFSKNADLTLQISENFDRSKLPILNKAIIAGKVKIEGDPQAARLYDALWTTGTEYARLTVSPGSTAAVLSDAARKEVQNMLNEYQNHETIQGLLDPETGTMRKIVKNKMDSLDETESEMDYGSYKKDQSATMAKTRNSVPQGDSEQAATSYHNDMKNEMRKTRSGNTFRKVQ